MFINNRANNKIDLNLYVILYFLKLKSEFEKRKLAKDLYRNRNSFEKG